MLTLAVADVGGFTLPQPVWQKGRSRKGSGLFAVRKAQQHQQLATDLQRVEVRLLVPRDDHRLDQPVRPGGRRMLRQFDRSRGARRRSLSLPSAASSSSVRTLENLLPSPHVPRATSPSAEPRTVSETSGPVSRVHAGQEPRRFGPRSGASPKVISLHTITKVSIPDHDEGGEVHDRLRNAQGAGLRAC